MRPRSQRPGRPPLTHFLCLPLLTPTSTPQLRASIAHLQSAINAREPMTEEADGCTEAQPQRKAQPLLPQAAFRPLGTLHLTLGVMSLKEPGKLQGALKLLQELDVDRMVREVSEGLVSNVKETVAAESALTGDAGQSTTLPSEANGDNSSPSKTEFNPDDSTRITAGEESNETIQQPIPSPTLSSQKYLPPSTPSPILISLRGLSHFPTTSPTNCRVLHTPPHDPTSRLDPLCHRLLQPFQKAGYIMPSSPDRVEDDDSSFSSSHLTLHATLINTKYANERRKNKQQSRSKKKKMTARKLTFDATDVLRIVNEENGRWLPIVNSPSTSVAGDDSEKTQNKTFAPTIDPNQEPEAPGPASTSVSASTSLSPSTFTFASHIAVDRVQICEMGAEKLDPGDDDPEGLGQKYVVVGEKKMTTGERELDVGSSER